MTAPVDLDHLDALAKASTPGPWRNDCDETVVATADNLVDIAGGLSRANAAWITASRNAYTAMSAELRLLRNVVEEQARLLDIAVRPDIHKATCVRLEMATERAETAERKLAETRADRDVWTRRTAVAERELAKAEAERDEYARALLVNE